MLNSTKEISQKCYLLARMSSKCLSTTAKMRNEEKIQSFRINEPDPQNHNSGHAAQYYRIPEEDKRKIFSHGGLPTSFAVQTKTFNETCVMVRKPTLDAINLLKKMDYSKPALRIAIYGKQGSGKSIALAHILHYAFRQGYLLVHIPWVGNWMRRFKERSNSELKEGYIDLNLDAAAWLANFKIQNEHILSNPEFKTTQEFVWNKREATPKDAPIIELIEFGISRVKYASSVVAGLCNEIKQLSTNGVSKTLVAIDGYNGFFYPKTKILTEKKEMVHPHKLTITEGFLSLTKSDWHNGAVVVTLDELIVPKEEQNSYLPRYLLGKDGFDHLDPFVPINIPEYDKKELHSCMEYFRERKWIQPYPGQDEELAFISAMNPYKLMKLCAGL